MKTFREQTTNDTLNPMFHQYGPTLLGPGMGQYHPIADLNAQKQLLGPNVPQGNFKEIKKSDLDQIEKYADRLFGALDIDVEFTRHFLDRVNDKRNKRPIVPSELTRLFKQTYKKFGKTIRKLGPDAEAVINDMKTDINMPFVLNLKGGELELVAKTVMRKKNFKTSNPKLSFEELVKEEFKFFPPKVYERITLPNPPIDMQRELDILKKIIASRTPEDEESIKNHDENSFYAIEKYCEKHGLIFHDTEMKDIVIGARDTIGYFKELFNVPRPFELDNTIKPMSSVTNKTRSYPSGHATQSRLVGLYVANKFPEHEKNIMEAAKECAMGRVQAGFHYLADYVAGNLLADKMFLVMNKDDYGKYLDESIGEEKDHKKDYETFAQLYAKINKAVDDASKELNKITSKNQGPMGLTDPKVKSSSKYKIAKSNYNRLDILRKKFLKGVPKDFMRKFSQRREGIGETKQEKEYVKDIARAMRGKGHENLKKYADDFEINALKSKDPEKELKKIPNIKRGQIANLLNMSEGIGEPNIFSQKNPRIPRKKGQPAGSKKHSDLYTDENPRGTIHGLGFKDVETARASVKKIENSGKKHAHKIQAAVAMEQRAKEMGKRAEAAIYRAYIEKMKKKTKEMRESPPDTSDAMKRYKSGKAGFTDIAHLKAKGLIKRSDGTKKKSDKYK